MTKGRRRTDSKAWLILSIFSFSPSSSSTLFTPLFSIVHLPAFPLFLIFVSFPPPISLPSQQFAFPCLNSTALARIKWNWSWGKWDFPPFATIYPPLRIFHLRHRPPPLLFQIVHVVLGLEVAIAIELFPQYPFFAILIKLNVEVQIFNQVFLTVSLVCFFSCILFSHFSFLSPFSPHFPARPNKCLNQSDLRNTHTPPPPWK